LSNLTKVNGCVAIKLKAGQKLQLKVALNNSVGGGYSVNSSSYSYWTIKQSLNSSSVGDVNASWWSLGRIDYVNSTSFSGGGDYSPWLNDSQMIYAKNAVLGVNASWFNASSNVTTPFVYGGMFSGNELILASNPNNDSAIWLYGNNLVPGASSTMDLGSFKYSFVGLYVDGLLHIKDVGGTRWMSINPGVQLADVNYTLPNNAPSVDGQVLSSTTTGNMSWVNAFFSSRVRATKTSFTQNVPALIATKLQFNNTVYDGLSEWSNASYSFTANSTGFYHVCASAQTNSTNSVGGGTLQLVLYLGGTAYSTLGYVVTAGSALTPMTASWFVSGCDSISLSSGNVVSVYLTSSFNTGVDVSATTNHLSIERIS
jgi:hypothetical protein